MRVRLMSPDEDFAADLADPDHAADLIADLELDHVLDAAAREDATVRASVRAAMLRPITSPEAVRYRQDVLADFDAHRDVADRLYDIAGRALQAQRATFRATLFGRTPERVLDRALALLAALADLLDDLHATFAADSPAWRSAGVRSLAARVVDELDEDYRDQVRELVAHLRFPDGMVLSAGTGPGGEITDPTPRAPLRANRRVLSRNPLRRPTQTWTVPDRDEAGFNALRALRDRAVVDVARAATLAAADVAHFFRALRDEVGFYRGCLALQDALAAVGVPTCRPHVLSDAAPVTAEALYDPCLALRAATAPVPASLDTRGRPVVLITGANHGGKTTLLRAIGLLHLMAGAGMPAPARTASVLLAASVHTHWPRAEDADLSHGKLDDELARLSATVDRLEPGALLLSNESFASTNAAEGARIALEVTRALVDVGVRVAAVTHLTDFATQAYASGSPPAVYYRAPRQTNGTRYTFEAAPPRDTAFAADLYEAVFGR